MFNFEWCRQRTLPSLFKKFYAWFCHFDAHQSDFSSDLKIKSFLEILCHNIICKYRKFESTISDEWTNTIAAILFYVAFDWIGLIFDAWYEYHITLLCLVSVDLFF